jgi:hypothetical protein
MKKKKILKILRNSITIVWNLKILKHNYNNYRMINLTL